MEKQSSLHMQKKTKTTKKKETVDPCPICNKELHLNHEFTQRVGLLNDLDEVVGWLCPHCNSEFDVDNHIMKFQGESSIRGEA
jgi:uncharacterized protein with PIN domain